MNIGIVMKNLREVAGLSQKELARRLNISGSSLSLFENGEREPSLTLIKSFSRELGVPVSVMFFQSGELPDGLNEQQEREWQHVNQLMKDVLYSLTTKRFSSRNENLSKL